MLHILCGGGGGGLNAFCVCVELGDWASEKLSGRVSNPAMVKLVIVVGGTEVEMVLNQ